jgi:hypothetical protein
MSRPKNTRRFMKWLVEPQVYHNTMQQTNSPRNNFRPSMIPSISNPNGLQEFGRE